ncbi:MAG: hypothetical protein ACQER1_18795, partial [Armatimonadota bacterium]
PGMIGQILGRILLLLLVEFLTQLGHLCSRRSPEFVIVCLRHHLMTTTRTGQGPAMLGYA